MFTTSSLFLGARAVEQRPPQPLAIVWKCTYGCWDFFTRCPIEEAESIVASDAFLTGLARRNYDVTQG